MNEGALARLEYPAIRALLAERTAFLPGRELALALHPTSDLREAERMGYKLAIVPGLLIKNVVGICEKMLDELRATHRHPAPVREMTVRETFQLWGADEWDALRTRFRDPADARREAAE